MTSFTLSHKAKGRDNNLNFVRFAASTCVLVSHSYPISLGPSGSPPLSSLSVGGLGGISVAVFFAISGFLISKSYNSHGSAPHFIAARVARVMPAYIVSLVFVAYALGPIVTSLPIHDYLTSKSVSHFVIQNGALFPVLQYSLPGVFEKNPYKAVVGCIWSLPFEIICYMAVVFLGATGILRSRIPMSILIVLWIGACKSPLTIDLLRGNTGGALMHYITQSVCTSVPFALGILLYVWRDIVLLSGWASIAAFCIAFLAKGTAHFAFVFQLAVIYAAFWFSFIPEGLPRKFNLVGDYSFGMYIYSFPVQGFVVWILGEKPMSPLLNSIAAYPITLALSIPSWHIIENPSLRARSMLSAWVKDKLYAFNERQRSTMRIMEEE